MHDLFDPKMYGPLETLQIEINAADTVPTYNVNMCGWYHITLVGFSVDFQTNPTYANIAISSPQLNLNYYVSNSANTGSVSNQYFSLYYPFTTHNANSMRLKIYYGDRHIQNQFQISIINADSATQAALANFTSALLTFEVRKCLYK